MRQPKVDYVELFNKNAYQTKLIRILKKQLGKVQQALILSSELILKIKKERDDLIRARDSYKTSYLCFQSQVPSLKCIVADLVSKNTKLENENKKLSEITGYLTSKLLENKIPKVIRREISDYLCRIELIG